MAKNIVILSDGTGQMGGEGHNTNIYKIFNTIENRTPQQVIYYDPGIGTGGAELIRQISGYGISKNILDCYRFLFEQYEAGDRIYLLGFSRGAATVRSLSGFIHYFGILPKSREDLIEQAYEIYKIADDEQRMAEAEAFIGRHHTMWTRIKFLGCFDTVAALGFPLKRVSALLDRIPLFRHRFHNFKLSKSVEHACHALAVDDRRKTFHPKLWDPEIEAYQTLSQVWFPGMHTDVGGGYNRHELSDIPLLWMRDRASRHGLRLYGEQRITLTPKADGFMHDSRGSLWQKIVYSKKRRRWPAGRPDKPVVHRSVLERVKKDKDYQPWILSGDFEVEAPRETNSPVIS